MDNSNQPPANDPYAPSNQPGQPIQPGNGGAMPPQQPAQPGASSPQPAAQPQQAGGRPPLRIDHNLLAELGLAALPEEEKKALEKHIYETLEMRVGMRLADQMTNEQLDEFETYFNARDDAGAFRWLETNFPNYKDIVADEFDKLKAEVAAQAPAILAAGQQQAATQPTDQPPAPSSPADPLMSPTPQPPAADQPSTGPQTTPPQPPQWPTPPMPSGNQQPPQPPPSQQ